MVIDEFEWDENKNQSNIIKHGLSFDEIVAIFTDPNLVTLQGKDGENGEARFMSIGRLPLFDSIVVVVVYTDRNERRRIISARKASKKERSFYEQV
jgi:uncharacterized DUF497 family protein